MKLNKKRNLLDQIDKKISKLLNERFLIVEQIKTIKEDENIPVKNLEREKEVLLNNEIFIEKRFRPYFNEVYKTLLKVSKDIQQQ